MTKKGGWFNWLFETFKKIKGVAARCATKFSCAFSHL